VTLAAVALYIVYDTR